MNFQTCLLVSSFLSVSAALASLSPVLTEVSLVVFGASFGALLIREILRENGGEK